MWKDGPTPGEKLQGTAGCTHWPEQHRHGTPLNLGVRESVCKAQIAAFSYAALVFSSVRWRYCLLCSITLRVVEDLVK